MGPAGFSPEENDIAKTIATMGSSGIQAVASRTFGILHVSHEPAIEKTHATGNERNPKTISHTSGLAAEGIHRKRRCRYSTKWSV
jgi:hypothetical protein